MQNTLSGDPMYYPQSKSCELRVASRYKVLGFGCWVLGSKASQRPSLLASPEPRHWTLDFRP